MHRVRLEPVPDHEERTVAAALFLDDKIDRDVAGRTPAQVAQGFEDEPHGHDLALGVSGAPPVNAAVPDGREKASAWPRVSGTTSRCVLKARLFPRAAPVMFRRRLAVSPVSEPVQAERIVGVVLDRIRHHDELRRVGEAFGPGFEEAPDLLLVPPHRGDPDQVAQEVDSGLQVFLTAVSTAFVSMRAIKLIPPPPGNQITRTAGLPGSRHFWTRRERA